VHEVMLIKNQISWHQYFMTMAYLVATKSKDPSTKVGAVIVGPDYEIRSTGFNGLPRGLADTVTRYDKPLKHKLINHAEENAILHCCRIGVPTSGCSLYVPWIPCSLCAKAIVQADIKRVIYHKEWPGNYKDDDIWSQSIAITKEIFAETGVELVEFSGKLVNITAYYKSKEVVFS
jgi:dCMP deaminase